LKETLIESAKQTLVSDLREMEIRGILEDRGITIQTLLRTYQEISLDQSNEYSKSANLPKIEVEKIIKNVYQILRVQYFKSTI
jgi:phage anti-repressor protein